MLYVIQGRANKIYSIVDEHPDLYQNHVSPADRSIMNVPFRILGPDGLPSEEMEKEFTRKAFEDKGMEQLFGHPLFGGQRVTCYNPVPDEAIDAVADFMLEYAKGKLKA